MKNSLVCPFDLNGDAIHSNEDAAINEAKITDSWEWPPPYLESANLQSRKVGILA